MMFLDAGYGTRTFFGCDVSVPTHSGKQEVVEKEEEKQSVDTDNPPAADDGKDDGKDEVKNIDVVEAAEVMYDID